MLRVFGLTGGIACGKSSVTRLWKTRGLPVVDADELAREVVAPGTPGLKQVLQAFGAVARPDGTLDRVLLARRVFEDPRAREELEAITHPLIRAAGAARVAELERAGEPLGCYEAALLIEAGRAEEFRPLVVVSAREDLQVERLRARNGLGQAEAKQRIKAQLNLAEKTKLADYVIENTGGLDELGTRADEVLDAICRGFGIDPARYSRA